ncbi:hypothetical protein, partial [Massilia genomosp. 1]|uniref:hypothetical protein n=1 Tax=Massilia genomosp. 1 TaxID=2609280 RepID=UPI001C9E308C
RTETRDAGTIAGKADRHALAQTAQIAWETHIPSSRKSIEAAQIQTEAAQIHDAKTMLSGCGFLNLGGLGRQPHRHCHCRSRLAIHA